MDNNLLAFKAAVVAFFGLLGDFLGWQGVMLCILVVLMALDYVSGTLAAKHTGTWSSKIAREGLFHKGGIILVVTGALLADLLFTTALPVIPVFGGFQNPGLFLPLVLAWYILTELGSVLENAVKMGAKVPSWFRRAIAKAGEAVDKAASSEFKDQSSEETGDADCHVADAPRNDGKEDEGHDGE